MMLVFALLMGSFSIIMVGYLSYENMQLKRQLFRLVQLQRSDNHALERLQEEGNQVRREVAHIVRYLSGKSKQ